MLCFLALIFLHGSSGNICTLHLTNTDWDLQKCVIKFRVRRQIHAHASDHAGRIRSQTKRDQVIKQAPLLSITCPLHVFFLSFVLLTQQPTSLLSHRHQRSSGLHPSKRSSSSPSMACGEHSLLDTSNRSNHLGQSSREPSDVSTNELFLTLQTRQELSRRSPGDMLLLRGVRCGEKNQVFFGSYSLSLYSAPTKAKPSSVLSTKCPSWVDRGNRWVSESSLQVISQRTHLLCVFSVDVKTTHSVSCNNDDVTFTKTWR